MSIKSIKSLKNTQNILILIILIASLLRFWNLGEIPGGMTEDEKTYIYNAYSIWHTQKDIGGNYLPLSFNFYNSFSPVPIYLMAPFVGLLDLSLFSARLPFAVMGVLDILLLFFITKLLFRKDSIALASSFVLAVSPWHLQFSRISYDGAAALFFFLCGIYLFLKFKEKGSILFSLPFFLLGFYSYHATKIFLLALIPLLLISFWSDLRSRKKELLLFLTSIATIFLSFILVVNTQGVTRQQVLLYNDTASLTKIVDNEREYSSAPNVLKPIFSNKITTVYRALKENYLHAFSPEYLFVKGEEGYSKFIYGTGLQGVLYLVELPLLLFGIWNILQKRNPARGFILAGLLLSPVPAAITVDQSYGMRTIMMLPFLAILIGIGIESVFFNLKRGIYRYIILGIIILGYATSIGYNFYQYHFLYSQYASETWHGSSKDLAEYISIKSPSYKNVFVSANESFLLHYATYAKLEPYDVQRVYGTQMPFKIQNVSLIGTCFDKSLLPYDPRQHYPKGSLYIVNSDCHKRTTIKPIYRIIDRGEMLHPIWDVYEI